MTYQFKQPPPLPGGTSAFWSKREANDPRKPDPLSLFDSKGKILPDKKEECLRLLESGQTWSEIAIAWNINTGQLKMAVAGKYATIKAKQAPYPGMIAGLSLELASEAAAEMAKSHGKRPDSLFPWLDKTAFRKQKPGEPVGEYRKACRVYLRSCWEKREIIRALMIEKSAAKTKGGAKK